MSLWDKITNQNLKDTFLLSQLSDISYKSTEGRSEKGRTFRDGIVSLGQLPFLEKPPADKITKEMILDYHKKQNEPIKNPFTGEYEPTDLFIKTEMNLTDADVDLSKVNLPFIDFNGKNAPADDADIANFNRIITASTNQHTIKSDELKQIQDDLKKKADEINSDKIIFLTSKNQHDELKQELDEFPPGNAKEKKKKETKLKQLEVEFQNAKTIYDTKLKEREILLNDFKQKIAEIKNEEDTIRKSKLLISQANENMFRNKQLKQKQYKEINKQLEDYKESIYVLNRHKINQGTLERQPNESNEDYLKRMQDFQNQQYDVNLYKGKADLEQAIVLKKNLRRLFNRDDLIENVIKSFTPEQQFQINKYFGAISEHVFDTYGRNNTNLTTKDTVEIITSVLERILNPEIEYTVEEETSSSTAPPAGQTNIFTLQDDKGVDTNFEYGVDNNSFVINNKADGKHVFFKIGEDNKGKNILLYSTDENKLGGHFKQVMNNRTSGKDPQDVLRNIINEYLKLDTYAKTNIVNNKYSNTSDFIDYIKSNPTFKIEPFKEGFKQRQTFIDKFGRTYYRGGAGLGGIRDPNRELPEYSRFGKLIIAPRKLYYKNILSVKSPNGRSVDGFNNCKVSNGFVDAIMDMYDNKDVSGIVDSLKSEERILFGRLLYVAGLHKKFKINNNETLRQLKEKYKIIEGEIEAGNNNPQLINQLKNVLYELYHMDAISIPAIKKYLKQFK